MGPAFHSAHTEADLKHIRNLAEQHSFSEMESPTKLRDRVAKAYSDWERLKLSRTHTSKVH